MDYTRSEMITMLKMHNVLVKFTKADGTEREMLCTLNEETLDKEKSAKYEKKTDNTKPINYNVVAVYDIEKKGWRSFRVDSIINFDPIVA